MKDTSRKAFETGIRTAFGDVAKLSDGEYANRHVENDWKVWQASRKALEAEQAANSRIASLYEELRNATDGGSESMTHDNALKQIAYWRDKDEQAQAVEPVAVVLNGHYQQRAHLDDGIVHNLYLHPAPPAASDRASLIHRADASVTALNSRIMEPFYCSLDQNAARALSDCVDMLEADAQEIEGWKADQKENLRNQVALQGQINSLKAQQEAPYDQQALELCDMCGWKAIMPGEPCFVCNMQTEAKQVAVPALKIKPFTQRLRDNREADYSIDALMPPTRKEIESAMHEEIVELRGALKAQQVAVTVPMSGYEISKWWASENGLEDCDMCIHGDFEKVVRAVEAHHGIGVKLVTKQDSKTDWSAA